MDCSNCDWEYLAPDEGTGRHTLDAPTETLDEILWELHEREQVQLASDAANVEPPYPMCSGYPTKRDCAVRGYCAREQACND